MFGSLFRALCPRRRCAGFFFDVEGITDVTSFETKKTGPSLAASGRIRLPSLLRVGFFAVAYNFVIILVVRIHSKRVPPPPSTVALP